MEFKTDDVLTKAAVSKRFGIPESSVDEWAKERNVPICTFAGESVYVVTNIPDEPKKDEGTILLQKKRPRKTFAAVDPNSFSGITSVSEWKNGSAVLTKYLQVVVYAGDNVKVGSYQIGYDTEAECYVLVKSETDGYEFKKYKGFTYRRLQVHIPVYKLEKSMLQNIEQNGGKVYVYPTFYRNGNIYLLTKPVH